MIDQKMIPDEVVAALVNSLYDNRVDVAWVDARAAIAAAFSAWPGMEEHVNWPDEKLTHIILPLPTEASDDK